MWKRRTPLAILFLALAGAGIAYYLNRSEPLFAQVVFGPEARLRVWFILDGDTVYLDRSGGDMPRRAERLNWPECKIQLADQDGCTQYIITRVQPLYTRQAVKRGLQQEFCLHVTVTGPVEYLEFGTVRMADRPEFAGIGHVNGPLTVAAIRNPSPLCFVAGGEPTDLNVWVTTQQANGESWIVLRSENEERNGLAGGPPIHRRFALNELC
jgi:hypothetical protein